MHLEILHYLQMVIGEGTELGGHMQHFHGTHHFGMLEQIDWITDAFAAQEQGIDDIKIG